MKKTILLSILVLVLLLVACQNIGVSKVSGKDLKRISEKDEQIKIQEESPAEVPREEVIEGSPEEEPKEADEGTLHQLGEGETEVYNTKHGIYTLSLLAISGTKEKAVFKLNEELSKGIEKGGNYTFKEGFKITIKEIVIAKNEEGVNKVHYYFYIPDNLLQMRIKITNSGFEPKELSIKPGTTVVFEATDASHKLTINGKAYPTLENGETLEKTFDTPGDYNVFNLFTRKSARITVVK